MEDFWNLESIDITDLPPQSDECALDNFSKTVTFADGRYMVTWPWIENTPDLPQNNLLAVLGD